jgi:hypothetical protein
MLVERAEALLPRPQNHLLVMSARGRLTLALSCEHFNKCGEAHFLSMLVSFNAR